MITKYLRELIKPIIQQCMNENESSISNRYIADMKWIHKDLYNIRITLKEITDNDLAADIADNISTYDIARNIDMNGSIDGEDVASVIMDNLDIEEQFTTIHEKIDKIEALLLNKTVSFEPKHKYLEVQID